MWKVLVNNLVKRYQSEKMCEEKIEKILKEAN